MGWWRDDYWGYPPKMTVGERRKKAAKQAAALEKKGKKLSPVVLEGSKIARTFWGKAWCTNLEGYSDYESRLPRGRSYVRSGSVIDLQIEAGKVSALVQGTSLYTVSITIGTVDPRRWETIVSECGGKIDSVVELLQGKLSGAVMEVITRHETGLFPAPKEIKLACSCPDWATMCKHVAAVLYGVGARLDERPELLFRLRGADPTELVVTAASGAVLGGAPVAHEKRLGGDLADVFGIELDLGPVPAKAPATAARAPRKAAVPRRARPRATAAAKGGVEHPEWCTCSSCRPVEATPLRGAPRRRIRV
jgi:hypothetical protein